MRTTPSSVASLTAPASPPAKLSTMSGPGGHEFGDGGPSSRAVRTVDRAGGEPRCVNANCSAVTASGSRVLGPISVDTQAAGAGSLGVATEIVVVVGDNPDARSPNPAGDRTGPSGAVADCGSPTTGVSPSHVMVIGAVGAIRRSGCADLDRAVVAEADIACDLGGHDGELIGGAVVGDSHQHEVRRRRRCVGVAGETAQVDQHRVGSGRHLDHAHQRQRTEPAPARRVRAAADQCDRDGLATADDREGGVAPIDVAESAGHHGGRGRRHRGGRGGGGRGGGGRRGRRRGRLGRGGRQRWRPWSCRAPWPRGEAAP